jgi:hypothetical protein
MVASREVAASIPVAPIASYFNQRSCVDESSLLHNRGQHVTVHESRVTSVQKRMEPRRYLPGASVDHTEARRSTSSRRQNIGTIKRLLNFFWPASGAGRPGCGCDWMTVSRNGTDPYDSPQSFCVPAVLCSFTERREIMPCVQAE